MPLVTCATASFLLLVCLDLAQAGSGGLETQTLSWNEQKSFSPDSHPKGRLLSEEQRCTDLLAPLERKVALLFIAWDGVPHEATWTRWLDALGGWYYQDIICRKETFECHQYLADTTWSNRKYTGQMFFSLYMHTRPDFPEYPEESVFCKRLVRADPGADQGTVSFAAALRVLLRPALADPFNERFQLMCPYSIPLRPALFTYTQLMRQVKSRIGMAGKMEGGGPLGGRLPAAMVKEWPDARVHSKYHDQFVTLTREHATVVLEDTHVYKLFEKHCSAIRERQAGHECVSDTQYIGTVLSTKLGKSFTSSVTDDVALVTGQPRGAFQAADVRVKTLIRLRGTTDQTPEYGGTCQAVEKPQFDLVLEFLGPKVIEKHCKGIVPGTSMGVPQSYYPHCPLFARKYDNGTEDGVFNLLTDLRII